MDRSLGKVLRIVEETGIIRGYKAFQKIAYLYKTAGLDIPFEFRWHLYGPYSYELSSAIDYLIDTGALKKTEAGITLGSEKDASYYFKRAELTEEEHKKLVEFKPFIKGKEPRKLELLASIVFALREILGEKGDFKELQELFREKKTNRFEKKELLGGIKELKKFRLLRGLTDVKED